MNANRNSSLQNQLIGLVLSAVLVIWLMITGLTWLDASHEIDEILDSHLTQAAALLVVQQAQEMSENQTPIDAPVLHRYASKTLFQVFHEDQLSLRSANAPDTPLRALGKNFKGGFSTLKINQESWRVFATEGAETDIKVFVAEKIETRSSILQAVIRSMLLPIIIALPLLSLAIWWAIRRGMQPLKKLGHSLEQRAAGSLEALSMKDCNQEMLPMVNALNDLFQRTTILHQAEQRFTADAAHELRTPIAAIRAQAQVALAENDRELRNHALQNTVFGCDRASRVIEQLLTLAKLESSATIQFSHIDLAEKIREVIAELAPRAISKNQNLAFEYDQQSSYPVQANEVLLSVLLRNLIDNAIRYSSSDSSAVRQDDYAAQILLHLEKTEKSLVLRIEDSGTGIASADIERLGERFFRLPALVDGNQSGTGLGWSIVRRIAEVHHIAIKIQVSTHLGGLAIDLRFPHIVA